MTELTNEQLLKIIGENTPGRINLNLGDLDMYLGVARAAIGAARRATPSTEGASLAPLPQQAASIWYHRGLPNFDDTDSLKALDDGTGKAIPLYTAEQVEQIRREAVEADRRAREVGAANALERLRKTNPEFAAHLERATAEVATWPAWKTGLWSAQQPASAAQGVKTWRDRLKEKVSQSGDEADGQMMMEAMHGEIADLRAQLAAAQCDAGLYALALEQKTATLAQADARIEELEGQLARQSQEPQGQVEAIRDEVLEVAALLCETVASDKYDQYKGRGKYAPNNPYRADTYTSGESDGADLCADKIRALKSTATPAHPVAQPAPTQQPMQQANVAPPVAAPVGQHDAKPLPARRFINVEGFFDADYVEFAEGCENGGGVLAGVPHSSKHYTRSQAESYVAEGAWREVAVPRSLEQSSIAGPAKGGHGEPDASAVAGAQPVAVEQSAEIARLIHYPHCWDTAAYPTLTSALNEAINFTCSVCWPRATDPATRTEVECSRCDGKRQVRIESRPGSWRACPACAGSDNSTATSGADGEK